MGDSDGCACLAPAQRGTRPAVTITATNLINPAGGNLGGSNPKIVELSVLDQVTAPHMLIRMPFLFSETLDQGLMSSALAAALDRLPLFAGRLRTSPTSGDYEVVISNAGASVALAACDAALADLLPLPALKTAATAAASYQYPPPDLSPFYPAVPSSILGYCDRDKPLLHAQITTLRGGGSALAIVIPHLLADQETCRIVIKTWAEEYTKLAGRGETMVAGTGKVEAGPGCAHTPSPVVTLMADSTVSNAPNAEFTYSKSALEAHAAPELPQGWTSARFEHRAWPFYLRMASSAVWSVAAAGGIDTVAYHVPPGRLAALKAEAAAALAAAGTAAPSSPAWISTRDALAARIRQVLAQLPDKAASPLQLWVNLRPRLSPSLPRSTLGNCSWTVSVRSSADSGTLPSTQSLGTLAAEVRAAIQAAAASEGLPRELRWLAQETAAGGGGARMPCVFKGAGAVLRPEGPVLVSHWDWGGERYTDVTFATAAPAWHQPAIPKIPNCVFVVPAAGPTGGAVVHITLHKALAAELRTRCPSL